MARDRSDAMSGIGFAMASAWPGGAGMGASWAFAHEGKRITVARSAAARDINRLYEIAHPKVRGAEIHKGGIIDVWVKQDM